MEIFWSSTFPGCQLLNFSTYSCVKHYLSVWWSNLFQVMAQKTDFKTFPLMRSKSFTAAFETDRWSERTSIRSPQARHDYWLASFTFPLVLYDFTFALNSFILSSSSAMFSGNLSILYNWMMIHKWRKFLNQNNINTFFRKVVYISVTRLGFRESDHDTINNWKVIYLA